MSGDIIELLIYHQPGVKPSLTLHPFGVSGYVAGHSLTDMKLHFTSGYHPKGNGQTEWTNQILEQYLWIFCNYQQDNWYTLCDPWGMFFIHLTYESKISHLKDMNSGWINLGSIFLHLFFSTKWMIFSVCFFIRQKKEISSHYKMNFEVYFSSVYGV